MNNKKTLDEMVIPALKSQIDKLREKYRYKEINLEIELLEVKLFDAITKVDTQKFADCILAIAIHNSDKEIKKMIEKITNLEEVSKYGDIFVELLDYIRVHYNDDFLSAVYMIASENLENEIIKEHVKKMIAFVLKNADPNEIKLAEKIIAAEEAKEKVKH